MKREERKIMETPTPSEFTLTPNTHVYLIGSMIYMVCFMLLFYPLTILQILIIFPWSVIGIIA